MWSCYIGEISESYRNNWSPHTVSPDQKEPDVHDVIDYPLRIGYRLDMRAARECFTDCIQVDWGGWAYRATAEQIMKYNETAAGGYRIPDYVPQMLFPGRQYGIIDVEIY